MLTVELDDPETGLVAEVVYGSPDGVPVLRGEVVLRNEGDAALHLHAVSSLAVGGLTPARAGALDDADLLWADNDWFAECRWQRRPLRLTSPALSARLRISNGRGTFVLAGQGAWSSCGRLPMGGLADRRTGRPGAEFRTVPVALAFGADGGTDTAFAALTEYRRATRRPHPDHERLPVIFNDYMNCLMGDPTGRPPSSGPCFPLTRPR